MQHKQCSNKSVETQSIDWQSIDYTDCMFTIKLITLALLCPQNPPSGPKLDFLVLGHENPSRALFCGLYGRGGGTYGLQYYYWAVLSCLDAHGAATPAPGRVLGSRGVLGGI